MLNCKRLSARFTNWVVSGHRLWSGFVCLSGEGATLHWTQETIATLHSVVSQLKQLLGVQRVRLLDVPCGDMAWMSRFLQTRDDVDYTGVDIAVSYTHLTLPTILRV